MFVSEVCDVRIEVEFDSGEEILASLVVVRQLIDCGGKIHKDFGFPCCFEFGGY